MSSGLMDLLARSYADLPIYAFVLCGLLNILIQWFMNLHVYILRFA